MKDILIYSDDGKTVVGVRDKSITSVAIPDSVERIGLLAFHDCTRLKSITIPANVKEIGNAAFSGCSDLCSIKVESANPIYISRDNCNAIIETTTNTLLAGCKDSTIPDSVTSIGDFAFCCCAGLTSIDIPDSVTSIGDSAFYCCTGLTSIDIPDSVTSIGWWCFQQCTALASIILPNKLTTIGCATFCGCSCLKSIIIPDSVKRIEWNAFKGCDRLPINIKNKTNAIPCSQRRTNIIHYPQKFTNRDDCPIYFF